MTKVKAWAIIRKSFNHEVCSVKFKKHVAKALLKLLNKKAIVKYKIVRCYVTIKEEK
jgi:hypothetical protein